ncbi:bifunctional DNA primase/polymerase [Pseudoblastomonas halimionae]|uniref:AAA family ATPase n=1 Tax=Alteriqipengyuania halimionae TaxID=1926630 RepID=A0A6I4U3Z3_9SPHN|nr:bifunctional DNA primase/polymerase [Alteriqipengyuania halimionae]MXP09635.1 AAA family ATPase [Alteriqipengyuania halimionae]
MNKPFKIRVTFDRPASVLGNMEWFARQGIRVLPTHGIVDGRCTCGRKNCEKAGKHPILALAPGWAEDATTKLKSIRKWHRQHPDMNYGVVTEDLTVIDCDSEQSLVEFRSGYRPPPTFTVKTARGFHFYFSGDMPSRNGAREKLDVKSGPGCYVVGPGSMHISGWTYALWEDEPFAQLPDNIASITQRRDEPPETGGDGPIPVGMRNSTLTQFAGYLHSKGVPQQSVLAALKALNQDMSEKPLPDREIRQIARSVSRYPAKTLPKMIPFSEIPEEKLEFLWYPYICLGTLGLLDGDPGDGKSQFSAWLCARISRGQTLPNGEKIKPANCFLLNFEDLKGAVIKPRLKANGADLSRVFIQTTPFDLSKEMTDWLDGEIAEKQVRLVFIDPIQATMTGVDGNSNIQVREFMSRLAEIADRRRCAIICVRHFGKGPQEQAMKKGLGSTDFVGISRNQFGLARRNDDVRGFIVFHLKTNFERGDAMLFIMGDADGREGEQPKISFDKFIKIDADEFLSSDASARGPAQDERQVARDYLLEALADGQKEVGPLKRNAEAHAISASTLDRARKELGIVPQRDGKKWYWALPPE